MMAKAMKSKDPTASSGGISTYARPMIRTRRDRESVMLEDDAPEEVTHCTAKLFCCTVLLCFSRKVVC